MTGIENGLVNGVYDNSLNGLCGGLMGQHQQISEVNTFIFTIKTTSTKTIVLPLMSTGTYNFWVDWGDGIKDFVRTYGQIYSGETVARTHTYPTALRNYTIKITGVCRGWSYFGLTLEQTKILTIERFGCLELISDANGQQFAGCSILDLSNVKDTPRLNYITQLVQTFQYCSKLKINLLNNWDVSKIFSLSTTFNGCSVLNEDIGNWNVSTVSNMGGLFADAVLFNRDISNWNVSNVTFMQATFSNAASFNQSIGSWDVSKVTSMNGMFSNAAAFDQNIGNWNVSICTNFGSFMSTKTPATFSAANLDAIYNGWSSRPSNSNLSISFGTANYTIAGGSAGRSILVSRGWTIVDGGGI